MFSTLLHDGVHDIGSEPLHSAHSETDVPVLVYGEVRLALVHVRIQDADMMFLAVRHNGLDLSHVVLVHAEVGCLELGRIMRLEPARLVTYPGIAGSVRFVERIRSELLPVLPYLLQHLLRVPVLLSALDELSIQRLENVYLLLTHRFTELVRLTFRETRHLLGDKHHLLLIDGDTISLLQELLHGRKVVCDRLLSTLSGNERRNIVHRARTVQRIHRDKVLETLRMQLLKPLHHSRRLELEHALRIAVRIDLVSLRVVDRNLFYVNVDSEPLLDLCQADFYDGQCPESQEVHLEHTHVLDERTLVLGYPHLLSSGLVLTERNRNIVSKIASSDNHRTGMDTDLPDASLELQCVFENLPYQFRTILQFIFQLRNVLYAVLQVWLLLYILLDDLEALPVLFHDFIALIRLFAFLQFHLAGLRDRDRLVRNHLSKPVGLIQRKPADTGHILDGALCGHSTERDDMGNMIDTISVLYILDDTITSVIIEVNINIRH